MRLVDFPIGESADTYPETPMLPEFDHKWLARQHVDAHLLVVDGENSLARASLWWHGAPQVHAERLGVVGHFAATDAASAALLLSRASSVLVEQGCTLAVGPMDGNTWRRYRLVTDPGDEPPFFLEPENPVGYPGYFIDAGFAPIAQYSSARVTDLGIHDERLQRAVDRLTTAGVRWRPLDRANFEAELRSIYRLSVRCFTPNFLYTPIAEADFLDQYRQIAPYVQPELTLMAEREGELLGYLFGIPDLNQRKRGETVDSFIVKTVAALPGRRSAGLGSVLVAESHRIAQAHGYRRAIHALMHENNLSTNISACYAHRMRRYTLYQRRLVPGR